MCEIWNNSWRHAHCFFRNCQAKLSGSPSRGIFCIYIYISPHECVCVCVCLIMWVRWQQRLEGAALMTLHTLCLVRNELWLLNMTNIPGDADNRRRMQHATREMVADVHKLIPLPIPAGPVHDSLLALETGCWVSMRSLGSIILIPEFYTKPCRVHYLTPYFGVSLKYVWRKPPLQALADSSVVQSNL